MSAEPCHLPVYVVDPDQCSKIESMPHQAEQTLWARHWRVATSPLWTSTQRFLFLSEQGRKHCIFPVMQRNGDQIAFPRHLVSVTGQFAVLIASTPSGVQNCYGSVCEV